MTKRFHMRLAFLSAEYPPAPGGVGDYTQALGRALVQSGHEVVVLTTHDNQFVLHDIAREREKPATIPSHGAGSWNWSFWRVVVQMLARVEADVLHIQYQTGAYGMHPAVNFLPWRLRRLAGAPPVVVTAHDLLEPYLFPKAGLLRRYVTARLLRDAEAVVLTNDEDVARSAMFGVLV